MSWIMAVGGKAQVLTSSNLPIIVINTKGIAIQDEPKRTVEMGIINNGPGKRNNISDPFNAYNGKIGIEFRGSTSQQLSPKKPFSVELRDNNDKDVSLPLLDLPAEEDWVLLAPYSDKSLMRDALTYHLAQQFSKVFVPKTRYCELVLDGQYQGIYLIVEKIKRDKNRVAISDLKSTDNSGDAVTGGYLLKIDKTSGAQSRSWNSPYQSDGNNIPIQIEFPRFEDITNSQFDYIRQYVTAFENVLQGKNFLDDAVGYRSMVDLESFVDYFVMTELTKNVDGYRLSTYFYKDRNSKNGKIVMGPLWDYNLAFGNADYYDGFRPTDWQYRLNQPRTDTYRIPFWWGQLMKDSVFVNRVKGKWRFLRSNVLKLENIHRYIDSTSTVLNEAQIRNFQRWPIIGQRVWPNYYVGSSYRDEVNFLKNWIKDRLTWLDNNLDAFTTITALPEPAPDLGTISLAPNPSAQELQVSYTVPKPGLATFQIMDITGRLVDTHTQQHSSATEEQWYYAAPDLGRGIYIIVYSLNGEVQQRARWMKL